MKELVIDNFAGIGGASIGIEQALGRPIDIAINHNPVAVAAHLFNHPKTRHFCEDIFKVDPVKATQGSPIGLAWFSPDCTHHSKAKGGKPRKKKIRGLAWVAIRWAATVRPRVIILENVEEFLDWGPLKKGQPDKKRKGWTFNEWVWQLEHLGYEVEWRELVAADYGAPTTRKRFYLIARCDGEKIVWPEPTHGPDKARPWRSAAECIDWSIPARSIFERKKPLAEKTLQRIARGIQKFVIEAKEPFIVGIDNKSSGDRDVWSADRPLTTIVTENRHALCVPFLEKYHGLKSVKEGPRGNSIDQPLKTLDTSNRYALVAAFLSKFYGTNTGSDIRSPIPTITGQGQHLGEVKAFLIKYYKSAIGQSLKEPMHTATAKPRLGLVTIYGELYQIVDICLRMLRPRELARGMGFPETFHLMGTNEQQVAGVGNSVCPAMAESLVKANVKLRNVRMEVSA